MGFCMFGVWANIRSGGVRTPGEKAGSRPTAPSGWRRSAAAWLKVDQVRLDCTGADGGFGFFGGVPLRRLHLHVGVSGSPLRDERQTSPPGRVPGPSRGRVGLFGQTGPQRRPVSVPVRDTGPRVVPASGGVRHRRTYSGPISGRSDLGRHPQSRHLLALSVPRTGRGLRPGPVAALFVQNHGGAGTSRR